MSKEETKDFEEKQEQAHKKRMLNTKARRKNYSSYQTFIYRTLKKEHPDLFFSKAAMTTLDSLVSDLLNRFIEETEKLTKRNGKSTVTVHCVECAAKLIIGRNEKLTSHAIANARKANSAYENNKK
jgi:histone H2B